MVIPPTLISELGVKKYEAALTLLKKPKNLELSIQDLIVKNQTLNKTIEVLQKEQSKRIKTELKK